MSPVSGDTNRKLGIGANWHHFVKIIGVGGKKMKTIKKKLWGSFGDLGQNRTKFLERPANPFLFWAQSPFRVCVLANWRWSNNTNGLEVESSSCVVLFKGTLPSDK